MKLDMVKEGTRTATDLLLHARILHAALEDSSDEDDSGDELDDINVATQVLATRYLFRSTVLKSDERYPARIFLMGSVRARRDLRISVDAEARETPVQLQLEVFLYSMQSLSYHNISQPFGIGEGTVKIVSDRVVEAVLALESSFIRWPTQTERKTMADKVQLATGFPNCVGFVDGISSMHPKLMRSATSHDGSLLLEWTSHL
ncbi:hypothetical protein PHYSODRAFT_299642 [Phytophthora sojae]|uniref:DDE Tnp4 domain-containing protein n=1 Tax=Phytophthora sojae (strain P6497) TaxID=1094619 RepID=G4Z470_PHYSP|nr:hypothetical protein PHYSODRAFT_299642 [Phytophthora sojae]EGZ22264.1 hypothetical protein PHYSODRAFT_299642 [Phytophthora sojae]|eukprot:XP_009524981.1 hypothetical protein PHYSODRAFT_299642 [Phytophthora sojae]